MSDAIKTAPTLALLRARRAEIIALAEKFGASNVRIFGSVARGEASPESDIDFLVDFADWVNLYDISELTQDLQEMLGFQVDVVNIHARTNDRFRQSVLREVVPL